MAAWGRCDVIARGDSKKTRSSKNSEQWKWSLGERRRATHSGEAGVVGDTATCRPASASRESAETARIFHLKTTGRRASGRAPGHQRSAGSVHSRDSFAVTLKVENHRTGGGDRQVTRPSIIVPRQPETEDLRTTSDHHYLLKTAQGAGSSLAALFSTWCSASLLVFTEDNLHLHQEHKCPSPPSTSPSPSPSRGE
ncbi:hypothetical protein E2C01_096045 [Portunus trituberculatus]|uniref:Uncharacterized protein n=1 Tax=Portunus trituberculatus TaxID=210409 RepID=A0A5B7JWY3_PORTR|nr:hypothetical protein [Portunus trituberculatus]